MVGRDDKAGDTWSPIPASYGAELTSQFNTWLQSNRSADQVAIIRREAGVGNEGLIPRLSPGEFTKRVGSPFPYGGSLF